MTTSCCPAFVKYVEKNYPELMSHVSTTVSPMISIAKMIRSTDKDAKNCIYRAMYGKENGN